MTARTRIARNSAGLYIGLHNRRNARNQSERSSNMKNGYRVKIVVVCHNSGTLDIDALFDADADTCFDALKAVVGQITGEDELKPLSGCQDYPASSISELSQAQARPGTQPSPYSGNGR